jgi:hypothetical protein
VTLADWVWIVLGMFFLLQGVVATYMIRSILRLRATQHRIANDVQIIIGQLETRGVTFETRAADGKASLGDAG